MLAFKHPTALEEILENIAKGNPGQEALLVPKNWVIVSVKNTDTSGGTELVLRATKASGYEGTLTFNYQRISLLEELYNPVGKPNWITFNIARKAGERINLSDIINIIRNTLGMNLEIRTPTNGGDINDGAITVPAYKAYANITINCSGNAANTDSAVGSLRNFYPSNFTARIYNVGYEMTAAVSVRDTNPILQEDGTIRPTVNPEFEATLRHELDKPDIKLMTRGLNIDSVMSPKASDNFVYMGRVGGQHYTWNWNDDIFNAINDLLENEYGLPPMTEKRIFWGSSSSFASWSYAKNFIVRAVTGQHPEGHSHYLRATYATPEGYQNALDEGYLWFLYNPSIV